jgi:hypothetical protein
MVTARRRTVPASDAFGPAMLSCNMHCYDGRL